MDIILFQHIDQFRERRRDKHTLFILHTLDPLVQHLLNNRREVIPCLSLRHFVQIHKDRDKRRLSVSGHQCDHLILDHLHAPVDLLLHAHFRNLVDLLLIHRKIRTVKFQPYLLSELFTAHLHKRRKVG